jgi:hypothetical protein
VTNQVPADGADLQTLLSGGSMWNRHRLDHHDHTTERLSLVRRRGILRLLETSTMTNAVLHVNRLHILKRFNQYLRTAKPDDVALDEGRSTPLPRAAAAGATTISSRSTAGPRKGLQGLPGCGRQPASPRQLRSTLPSRSSASVETPEPE